jgi:YD repeat-containing protein
LRKLLIALAICVVGGLVVLMAGPLTSGALLLLLPAGGPRVDHDLPESYRPFHKGHVDIATGLYIREDEDIVVRGTPPLVLRRTYLSNYHANKQFGIGTTHPGEWYVVGDGERFTWAALILADGGQIRFERTSAGHSFLNAMYEHHATPGEWQGAALGWTGLGWALRRRDGALARFRGCGPGSVCSILQMRDPDGHIVTYRRAPSGRLARMEASRDRWIAFDYDADDRIRRAYSSAGDEVRYDYDARGRLVRAVDRDGAARRYSYTDADLMATIEDPGHTIENEYDGDGRCVRQVNRYPDGREPYIFTFAYAVEQGAVVAASTTETGGIWSRFTFGKDRYTTSEIRGSEGIEPTIITYDRDSVTNFVTGMTVTCPDRTGRPLRHDSLVKPGWEDWTKWDLLQTHCSSKKRPGQSPGALVISSR